MAAAEVPLCTRAAFFVAKYDIHCNMKKPMLVPDSVIIDPDNRDGLFPTVGDVMDLGDAIIGCGFNLGHTRGICCQFPGGDVDRAKIIQYNIDKGSSDPCFPEVLVQHAMYSGVAGNTLNTFLRCVSQSRAAMPDKLKQVTGAGGHFSVEGLRAVDPIFAGANRRELALSLSSGITRSS
jgi:hypothetical protein